MEKNSDAALMDAGGFPLMSQLTQLVGELEPVVDGNMMPRG